MKRFGYPHCVRTLATFSGPVGVQASEQTVNSFLKTQPTTQSLRSALLACANIEAAYRASSRPDYHELPQKRDIRDAENLLSEVLAKYANSESAKSGTKITNQTLLEYFTNEFPPSTESSIKVLQAFAKNSNNNVVPERIAMIPFRRAVYDADFRGALDIMDHTCGIKSNYKTLMTRKLMKMGAGWSVVTGSSLTGVYTALTSGYFGIWEPGTAAMICGMFGTYIAALTLYGAMTVSGSKSGLGSVLEWIPGTSPLYRYNHGEQLKMATFVTELNRSLPENLGECSPQLLQDLQKINLKPVESQSEAYLKEYWARGGAGFDWAEPDQDPSELLWSAHMEANRQQRIGSAYSRKDSEGKLLSWISEVEKEKEGKSIPHASLLGVDELRGELHTREGMLSFEEELKKDMESIKNRDHRQIGPGASSDGDHSTDASATNASSATEGTSSDGNQTDKKKDSEANDDHPKKS